MLRLLVVDDERDICDFVKNFFKERDFDVIMAYNGQEALEKIEAEDPDIILLDIKMPVMGGLEVLKALQGRGKKVIMVTAVEDGEKARDAKKWGAVEYITKPLMLEQLERTVMTVAEQIKMEG
ncbi:MAG: response regulator [Candidatus Omnitrophota bacterium]|nr:response regulator [Candidatus Omnitrophota bacterium]